MDYELEQLGREFWDRFQYFRHIEEKQIGDNQFNYSLEALALLRDAELCYAAKAYFACIVMAHSIIEIYLRRVEGLKGTAADLFRKAGINEEVEWLRKLRNAIAHGNANHEITYVINDDLETVWENYCIKAFVFMHKLPIRLYKGNQL